MLKAVSIASDTAADITIGTSIITNGTDTRVLFDDAGVVGEDAGLTFNKTTDALAVVGAITAASETVTGIATARSATATPAAASAVKAFAMGSAGVGLYWGTGSPNTALSAPKGSLYLRTDGAGATDRAYINTDGSSAWTNLVTAG